MEKGKALTWKKGSRKQHRLEALALIALVDGEELLTGDNKIAEVGRILWERCSEAHNTAEFSSNISLNNIDAFKLWNTSQLNSS